MQVRLARRLSLEWQAYVVRTHALRKVFVTVKGFNYQVCSRLGTYFSNCQCIALRPSLQAGLARSLACRVRMSAFAEPHK